MIRFQSPQRTAFTGWTLSESLQRVTGSASQDGDAVLWKMLLDARLIAYGFRKGQLQRLGQVQLRDLTFRNYSQSSASPVDASQEPVTDIRVSPVLLARDAPDLLAGMALSEAIRQHVFGDPEVQCLARPAIAVRPELAAPLSEGTDSLGMTVWSLRPDGGQLAAEWIGDDPSVWPRDPLGQWLQTRLTEMDLFEAKLIGGVPPGRPRYVVPSLLKDLAAAVTLRFGSLVDLLTVGRLEGEGIPLGAGGPRILHSVWSHDAYRLDVKVGDLLEEVDHLLHWLRPCWRAIVLRKPVQQEPRLRVGEPAQMAWRSGQWIPLKELTRGEESVLAALNALFPSGTVGVKMADRDRRVAAYLKEHGRQPFGPQTVARCMRKVEFRPAM